MDERLTRGRIAVNVIEEIAAERQRQIDEEGYDAQADDELGKGQLALAAACYAFHAAKCQGIARVCLEAPPNWPWAASWWKPNARRHDLIRAAALLVAEIERLDRAARRG